MRTSSFIGALLTLAGSSACGQISDPAVPCSAIAIDEARAATVAAQPGAAVIAMSDAPRPWIVHWRCPPSPGRDVEPSVALGCSYQRTYLESELSAVPAGAAERGHQLRDDIVPLGGGSTLLVTSTGRFVVAVDLAESELRTWRIDPWAEDPVHEIYSRAIGGDDAAQLVAGMRGSDMVLVRDTSRELRWLEAATGIARPVAPDHPQLKIVAIGESYVVGREVVDGDHDRVVLVPIGEDHEFDGVVDLPLAQDLSRVEITADDAYVVVTSGEGEGAETSVYGIPDGDRVDRFSGSAVNGNVPLEVLPGLRATTPDGVHLAYRTSTGALAMRELGAGSACLVRSASAGDHSLAGFAADGMLYMQADGAYSESHLLAFDPTTRRMTALDPDTSGHHLVAVPPRLADRAQPWAVGVHEGSYAAMRAGGGAMGLGLKSPVFVPRLDDANALWVGDTYEDASDRTRFGMRRIQHTDAGFVPLDQSIAPIDVGGGHIDASLTFLSSNERPCLSTGTPGGWAYQCGNPRSGGFLANAPAPGSENPRGDDDQPPLPTND
ncbi:MAG: hypothetical protein IPH07_05685 [Deltaproteobacteria bacterium]|nr:hypothetical protein [Deltaproteobacteria bacterium]MBK8719893.1 hypothetical protein [Deltaproteobacteria bacterium]MBP7290710.1 hypothetical protein [Nannocystaceae bacterium]